MELFKAEDFYFTVNDALGSGDLKSVAANQANAKFNEWLEKQPEIFGQVEDEIPHCIWMTRPAAGTDVTHKARLVAIEEIKQCQ